MLKELPEFITKLSLKELGAHLKGYYELYTKPIESWKRAYSQRKSGFDFTILNIIYYFILVLLIFQDAYLAVKVVLLEILVTLMPLSFFIIPFVFCTKTYKIHKKWTKLFRVFLIIKFQLIPPLVLLILFAKWSEIEILYLIIENGVMLIFIGFVLAVPLISSISLIKKAGWAVLNYVFLLIGIFMFSLGLRNIDKEDKFLSKLQLNTPNLEYINVSLQSTYSIYRFEDKGYVATFKPLNNEYAILMKGQFSTPDLALIIIKNYRNELIKSQIKIDSILSIQDTSYVPKEVSHELENVIKLTSFVLDSIYKETNQFFHKDLKLFQEAKNSSKFDSNRKYFDLYVEYLMYYEQLFCNLELQKKIVHELKPLSIVEINNNEIVAYYWLPDSYLFGKKEELFELKNYLDKRIDKSSFLMDLVFFPLNMFDGI